MCTPHPSLLPLSVDLLYHCGFPPVLVSQLVLFISCPYSSGEQCVPGDLILSSHVHDQKKKHFELFWKKKKWMIFRLPLPNICLIFFLSFVFVYNSCIVLEWEGKSTFWFHSWCMPRLVPNLTTHTCDPICLAFTSAISCAFISNFNLLDMWTWSFTVDF